ncbi:hypothetical protein ACQ4PT_071346 [Festuca glaucescens]
MVMSTALKAFTVLFVLAVLAPDQVEGRHQQPDCPSFSCGPLDNVSSPFRQASDPPECGYPSYELVCSDSTATIHIDNATYYVSSINYSGSSFWVIDAELDLYNSCPIPQWNQNLRPTGRRTWLRGAHRPIKVELVPVAYNQANFVKCCREVKDNGMYMPVACLSTSYSFVYVLTGLGSNLMENLEPCCGYLAMTPLGDQDIWGTATLQNASYADVVKIMMDGFGIRFPFRLRLRTVFIRCLMEFMPTSPEEWIGSILRADVIFLGCAAEAAPLPLSICLYVIQVALEYLRLIAGSCWHPWWYSSSLPTSIGKQGSHSMRLRHSSGCRKCFPRRGMATLTSPQSQVISEISWVKEAMDPCSRVCYSQAISMWPSNC